MTEWRFQVPSRQRLLPNSGDYPHGRRGFRNVRERLRRGSQKGEIGYCERANRSWRRNEENV